MNLDSNPPISTKVEVVLLRETITHLVPAPRCRNPSYYTEAPSLVLVRDLKAGHERRNFPSLRVSAVPVSGGWHHTSRLLRCVRCKMRACQHSMTIMASASRAVQEPAALAIAGGTGPGSGWAFTDRTHAKQRHVCATRQERIYPLIRAERLNSSRMEGT